MSELPNMSECMKKICQNCRFSYPETWELLNLFAGTKILATIFAMKTNQVLRPFLTSTEQFASKEE